MQSGERKKNNQAKAEVVASTIVEAGEQAGDIQEITMEAEVVVEVAVETVDQMEDILATLVER